MTDSSRSVGVLPSILGAIGQTPLVRLDRLVAQEACEGTILAKLDYLNPGFSKKDRIARQIIERGYPKADREAMFFEGCQTLLRDR